jgi:hypothetical protein
LIFLVGRKKYAKNMQRSTFEFTVIMLHISRLGFKNTHGIRSGWNRSMDGTWTTIDIQGFLDFAVSVGLCCDGSTRNTRQIL